MSTQIISGRNTPTSEFVMVDPTTGLAIGTTSQPLQTATSNLQTTSDLTKAIVAITTATTTAVVSATASVRTRVYRIRIDVAAAQVVTIVDAAGSEEMNFTAAGFRIYDFATRPWFSTAVNTALNVTTTTTGKVNMVIEFTKAA